MEATTPSPLAVADAHYGESPRRSLRQASEVAPYLAKAEVLVAGHTFAPPGRPATSLVARLALLSAGQVVLDKALRILGDVDRAGHVLPFMHMPLVYERALFDADENPVGVVPRPGLGPNILLARSPERPGGFGPLAPRWPSRLRLAGGELPAAAADAVLALPGGFSWAHFQAAPRDQHIDFLRGDETLVLGSLHPAFAPRAHAPARSARGGAAPRSGRHAAADSAARRQPRHRHQRTDGLRAFSRSCRRSRGIRGVPRAPARGGRTGPLGRCHRSARGAIRSGHPGPRSRGRGRRRRRRGERDDAAPGLAHGQKAASAARAASPRAASSLDGRRGRRGRLDSLLA
jgi:hypothetical protein